MKEDHRVSRSRRAKNRFLLHFKGSAEKYQSSGMHPERCTSVHGRWNAQKSSYVYPVAGFQARGGSQVEPINMENAKKLRHHIYSEEQP